MPTLSPRVAFASVLLCAVLSTTGCDEFTFTEPVPDVKNAKTASVFGVSFDYPGNWKLEQDNQVESATTIGTLTAESPVSGLILVQVFKPALELDAKMVLEEFTKAMPGAMDETAVGSVASVKQGAQRDVTRTLLGEPRAGKSASYTITLLGEASPHTVEVFAFPAAGVSLAVYMQGADEDLKTIKPAFDLMVKSLRFEATVAPPGQPATPAAPTPPPPTTKPPTTKPASPAPPATPE